MRENILVGIVVTSILAFLFLLGWAIYTSPTFAEECRADGGRYYNVQGYQACEINGVVIRNGGE
jgi:hypothetical protein